MIARLLPCVALLCFQYLGPLWLRLIPMNINSLPVRMNRLFSSVLLLVFLAFPLKGSVAAPQGSAANNTLITLLSTPGVKNAIHPKVLRKALEGYYALSGAGQGSAGGDSDGH